MAREKDPLLRYAKRPSRRRLAEVVRAYHKFVWRVALRISGNHEDAADVSQDVFLKLLLEPPAPAAIRSPGAYLAWGALGRARFLRRSRERQQVRERRFAEELATRELEGVAEPDADLLQRALEELSLELRDAVELRYLAGLSPGQTAEALGISERALYQRLAKARGRLRRTLGPLALASIFGFVGVEPACSAPPEDFVPRLLEIVNRGSALSSLSSPAVPAALGGIVMVKKITVSLLVVLALLTTYWLVPRVEDPPVRQFEIGERSSTPQFDRTESPPEEPGKEAAVDKALLPSEPPRGVVKGRLVDLVGDPVSGAQVECRQYMGDDKSERLADLGYRGIPDEVFRLAAWSDERGEFAIGNLFPGPGYVRVNKEGYFQVGNDEVTLVAGEAAWKEMELDFLKRVSGTLRGGDDLPLADGIVFFERGRIHDPPVTLGDDDLPRFAGVPVDVGGSYDTAYSLKVRGGMDLRVKAWARGHAMLQHVLNSTEFHGREARLDLELVPELPITLWVRDSGGDPVEGAEVGLGVLDFPHPAAYTDENGFARVEHLEPKENRIRVLKEGYRPTSVRVRPGESTDVSVTLRPLGEAGIEARVVFEGDAVYRRGSVHVRLYRERDDGEWVSPQGVKSEQDDDGLTTVYWPPDPGRFRFLYRHHRGEYETDPFEHTGVERVEIDLPVPLELRPPYVMGKVVSEESGEPVPGALVEAHWFPSGAEPSRWREGSYLYVGERSYHFPSLPGRSAFRKADEEGRFLFLPKIETESTFVVNVRNRPEGVAVPKGSRDVGWSQEVAFEIDGSSEVDDVHVVVERGAVLEGHVVDGGGNPVVGELVALYDGRSLVQWSSSNDKGDFRFRSLRAGSYALEPLGSSSDFGIGFHSGNADVAGLPPPEEFFGLRISLSSGETGRIMVDLSREALGAIEGRVSDAVLPKKARVRYGMIVGGRAREDVMTFGGEARVTDGRFMIEGLFPGRYRLSTAERGPGKEKLMSVVEVDVARARSARVFLDLSRGRLFLPVPFGEEGPVAGLRVVAVERLSHVAEDGTEHWEPLEGYEAQPVENGWTVEKVLTGRVRLRVIAPGYRESWTEGVEVSEAHDARLPPFRLTKGIELLVRFEPPDGVEDGDLEFDVYGATGRTAHTSRKGSRKSEWILSALAPGDYRLRVRRGRVTLGRANVTVRDGEAAEVRVVSEASRVPPGQDG